MHNLRSLYKDLELLKNKRRTHFGGDKKTLKQKLWNNKGKLVLSTAALVGAGVLSKHAWDYHNKYRLHPTEMVSGTVKSDRLPGTMNNKDSLSKIERAIKTNFGNKSGLSVAQFRKSRFGVEEKISDSRKIFLGTVGASVTAHVGLKVYQRKLNNKINDKINILENKFIKCNIPFKQLEKKNYVSKSSYTDNNLEKRISNLENALNSYNKSQFGNNNVSTPEINNSHKIISGVIAGGTVLGLGTNMFMFKRKMNKYIKRLDVIEKKLKNICK